MAARSAACERDPGVVSLLNQASFHHMCFDAALVTKSFGLVLIY